MPQTDKLNIGVGLSTKKDCLQAVKEAVLIAKTHLSSDTVNLAICFSTPEYANSGTIESLSQILGSTPVIGCSSAAILSGQGVFKQGIVVALMGFPSGIFFNTAFTDDIKTNTPLSAGENLGEKLVYGFQEIRRDLGIIFSDGLIQGSSILYSGLQEKLGASFPIIGACASDNLEFKRTFVYYNQQVLSDAACGVVWGGKLNFGLGIKHGWKPIGKPREITKSIDNIVYEIDGKSATNVYEEYFACDLERLKKDSKRISIFYPIGIYLTAEREYLLRNIVSIEDNGSLIFQGNVPEKSMIRLMIGTKESCLEATLEAALQAKEGLAFRQPQMIIVFDSISRYTLLGRDMGKELDIIHDNFGKNIPLIGLCTFGEQAPLRSIDYKGKSYLHNQTIAILTLGV